MRKAITTNCVQRSHGCINKSTRVNVKNLVKLRIWKTGDKGLVVMINYPDPATVSDTFAFIIHPINPKRDVSRKWPLVGKVLTEGQVNYLSAYFPPVYISEITGVRSQATG